MTPIDLSVFLGEAQGDMQLLICLQCLPQPQLGGDLELEGEPVPLAAGDALLFAATRLHHGISRIGGERLHRSRYSRVVLALRLFGGGLNHAQQPRTKVGWAG